METLRKKSIFWDVDPNSLNAEKNKGFVLDRVLNFGNKDDVAWAMHVYGPEKIKKAVVQSRSLDRKSISFWCQYFNINPSACTSTSSKKTPNMFSSK